MATHYKTLLALIGYLEVQRYSIISSLLPSLKDQDTQLLFLNNPF